MDGLEDAYETGRSMGDFGEATAEAYQFTRKDQDSYAMETLTRARKAVEGGAFKAEIAPITSVRDQRGLCRGGDGGAEGSRHPPREA
jgi:acetyl-CoA C-acetyltransferase